MSCFLRFKKPFFVAAMCCLAFGELLYLARHGEIFAHNDYTRHATDVPPPITDLHENEQEEFQQEPEVLDGDGGRSENKIKEASAQAEKREVSLSDPHGADGNLPICYRQNLTQPARCPNGRHSIIYWNARIGKQKGVGLSDIVGRVRILGNLAEYVCARLILPPPSEFLALEHNRGHKVPEEAKWKDYFRVTTKVKEDEDAYDDDDEALVVREDLTLVQAAEFASSLEQKNASRHMILTGKARNPDAIARTAVDQLSSALDFVKDDITFAWRMDHNPYTFVRPLMELAQQAYGEGGNSFFPYVMSRNREEGNRLDGYGCVYMRWEYSHVQRRALEEFRRLAGLVRTSENAEQEKVHFAYLQVRRFDVGGVPTCDSSKEAMEKYLKCSLQPCRNLEDSNGTNPLMPVVFFSDETNQTYLEELHEVISHNVPRESVIRGDKIVLQALLNVAGAKRCENDNFFSYSLQLTLSHEAAHIMKRHRNWCHECDPYDCRVVDRRG